MEEEQSSLPKDNSETKTETPEVVSDSPKKSKVEEVRQDLDELKKVNDEVEQELLRTENLRARKLQAGQAGQAAPVKPQTQDDKDQEQADLFLKGDDDV